MILAAPIFHPAHVCGLAVAVGDGTRRNQNRIISERRKNHLIDRVLLCGDGFSEIPFALNPIERLFAFSGIESTQHVVAVGEKSNSGAEMRLLREIIVQELWRAFVLAHLHTTDILYARN